MVQRFEIEGYKNFVEFMENLQSDSDVYVYFSGAKLPSGESWCDDCVRAKPVVEAALEKLSSKDIFVYVEVGDRPTWKDPKCPFRLDSKTKLMVIPTLLKWKHPQRLEGEQCENPDLLDLLFNYDDD